jgi:hypothetical protein
MLSVLAQLCRSQRKNPFGVRLIALGESIKIGDQRQRRGVARVIPSPTGAIVKPQSGPPRLARRFAGARLQPDADHDAADFDVYARGRNLLRPQGRPCAIHLAGCLDVFGAAARHPGAARRLAAASRIVQDHRHCILPELPCGIGGALHLGALAGALSGRRGAQPKHRHKKTRRRRRVFYSWRRTPTPGVAAPGRDPDRGADATCRRAAPPTRAAWPVPAPIRGSASCH